MSQKNSLETLKKWREGINWQIKNCDKIEFFRPLVILIKNWEGKLPNLRDIFRKEEIDDILICARAAGRDIIRFVAETGYEDVPDVDKDGKPLLRRTTALHLEAGYQKYRHTTTARQLFHIYNKFDVNYVDENGVTHFHVACESGFDDVVKKFLELGQDPNCLTKNFSSPLYMAMIGRHEQVVKLLLSKGADPNFRDMWGRTPLWLGFEWGSKKVTELLLRSGACPNLAARFRMTPLHVISNYGNLEFMEMFFKTIDDIQKTVEVNAQDENGDTPLRLAVEYNETYGNSDFQKMVSLLLRRGADPNLANTEGLTPLHAICQKDNHVMLEYFLEINDEIQQTVHVNAQDKEGNTPLLLALQADHQKMAEYLLEKGANPHLTNARGLTALHAICNDQKDHHALVKTIFKICKAKHQLVQVDARDNLDRTPLQLAVANLSLKTVDVLLKRGADLDNFALPTMNHFYDVLNPDSMSYKFKSYLASSAMELVELLEKKGYELDRKEALEIMALFAKYGLFQKSKDLEEQYDIFADSVDRERWENASIALADADACNI
ncbi:unnamed protein product [Trichogramma brassicae]|uniref:Uncharacterized protein n=1 Tax=Trichogramma brassicae TaxID=86971 RepID=A0A6H5I9D4_9HYME|nr:unnamed protein product [Trichogramma brassicae]